MRVNGVVVVIYALLVMVGGMIGFIKANSVPSLVMGMIFSLGLLLSAVAMIKGLKLGYYASILLATILTLFFAYRYMITHQIMPAGVMSTLSIIIIIALILGNKSKEK